MAKRSFRLRSLLLMGVVLTLGACAFLQPHVRGPREQGQRVVVTGSAEARETTQVGRASWYGPGFNGRRTASGEIFNQQVLSAAHPTLELPSLVRVTNLENGRSVLVRVNDRGPHRRGRIIDLSKAAAKRLGFIKEGVARVRVEVIREGNA